MTGCTLWTKYTGPDGYGRVNRTTPARPKLAHRDAWERTVGPIPQGYELHHRCGVRACVNVAHLQLVTPQEHKAIEQAARTHCRRGHDYATEGHVRANGRRYCRACERRNYWKRKGGDAHE